MLRKHARTLANINRCGALHAALRTYFNLPSKRMALTPALYQKGLGQADLVLALLRIPHPLSRLFIESLIGHPITIGSPCLLGYRTNGRPHVVHSDTYDDRRITFVTDTNPRQHGTDAHLRWSLFQVGRTVGQLRVRGCKRRDIRRAARKGWITLEARA